MLPRQRGQCKRPTSLTPKCALTCKPNSYDVYSCIPPNDSPLKEQTMKGLDSKKAAKKEPAKTMKEKKEAKKIKKAEKTRQ